METPTINPTTEKLLFSGHETFTCKQFWLKKGVDFVLGGKKFYDDSAVVGLGVGNNMVTSINFWLKAFNLLDDSGELTDIALKIFSDKQGWDPFIEDEGTLWLLHYLLYTRNRASIYFSIFSELRKQKPEFTRKHFYDYVLKKDKSRFTERTLKDDFSVFTRTYLNDKSNDIEDGYSGLLADLNLLREIKAGKENGGGYYTIENKERQEIPDLIILYAILSNQRYGASINFNNLYSDKDGVGTIFALNKDGLIEHLQRIEKRYPKQIVFKNDPLARELQFKGKKMLPMDILKDYYGN